MFKTVVLLRIFVETEIYFIFQDSLMNRKFKRTAFKIEIYGINVFTVTFDQFNASLLKSINFFTDPIILNGTVPLINVFFFSYK